MSKVIFSCTISNDTTSVTMSANRYSKLLLTVLSQLIREILIRTIHIISKFKVLSSMFHFQHLEMDLKQVPYSTSSLFLDLQLFIAVSLKGQLEDIKWVSSKNSLHDSLPLSKHTLNKIIRILSAIPIKRVMG